MPSDGLLLVGRRVARSGAARLRHTFARSGRQDFFEVYEAAGEAIERARAGEGPSLLHVS